MLNNMKLEIPATSINESFARATVAAFAAQLNPTIDQINDIKTAVSEAVTNCVVHANTKIITIECELDSHGLLVRVIDKGKGIKDVDAAMQPFVTTQADQERSGMGFTVMQSFMDNLNVESALNKGTTVTMQKFLKAV